MLDILLLELDENSLLMISLNLTSMAACVVSTELYGSTTEVEVWGWWYFFDLVTLLTAKILATILMRMKTKKTHKEKNAQKTKFIPGWLQW